jgi:hypothetical protein
MAAEPLKIVPRDLFPRLGFFIDDHFRSIMRGAAQQCATPVYDHHINIQERPHEIDA